MSFQSPDGESSRPASSLSKSVHRYQGLFQSPDGESSRPACNSYCDKRASDSKFQSPDGESSRPAHGTAGRSGGSGD